MNIFMDDDDLEEIKPVDPSIDFGKIITPSITLPDNDRKDRSDEVKEIIGTDAINMGTKTAALIHGVSESSVKRYSNGDRIQNEDIKTRMLARRHEIQDLAIVKLLQTLNLINPDALEKERDKVTVMNGLATVLDKLTETKKEGERSVVLHLHMPTMKKEQDFGEVIEVRNS